ncbi:palmitoyltransferase ZDHHC3-like isoform X1 [Calypte anna]|uniref:palmitoyltransferase ZDHHC3-like isoform X1 n=1 Tax=Calypte anna TaxID=9244 RepID=UPI0011C3935F|nr:palmitoyltransferase ZDHHC3-like isoform X1 [Calypte anna]
MAAAAAARCGRDPCGALCPLLTYLGVGYADYAVLAHVLPQPALRGSPWCPVHAAAFNLIVLLLLASHARAVLADPGLVPLPDTAIDFSDLRSAAPRKPEKSPEEWTVCERCEAYRPPRAHHCRVCHRCVRRMDHHCPWINNCVGELNQKYFIQFLFYTACSVPGLASLYAAGLVLATWLGPPGRSPVGTAAGGESGSNRIQTAHSIVLLFESLLFGAFVAVVFYDQLVSIITDETPLEKLQKKGLKEMDRGGLRAPRPKLALLREVFGRGFVLCWLCPCSCSPPPGPGYSPLPSRYV